MGPGGSELVDPQDPGFAPQRFRLRRQNRRGVHRIPRRPEGEPRMTKGGSPGGEGADVSPTGPPADVTLGAFQPDEIVIRRARFLGWRAHAAPEEDAVA